MQRVVNLSTGLIGERTLELILASTSPYRRELLLRLGVEFHCVAPDVDESVYMEAAESPELLAKQLARLKSQSVSGRFPEAVVIGSDQVVEIEGRILCKPLHVQAAVQQLATIAGKTHRLITAVAVSHPAGCVEFVNETRLTMRPLSTDQIQRYVSLDMPLNCAGSYMIEKGGISLFEHLECSDFTAITGLPLMALTHHLNQLGMAIP